MSVSAGLANVTLAHLNFAANCSNLALGLVVFANDFLSEYPNPGNSTFDNSTTDDGPGDYTDFWTNGTAPEWIGFWRAALGSALPDDYLKLSDSDIAMWANTTEAFDFFGHDVYQSPDPTDISQLSNYLAIEGGCRSYNSSSSNILDLVGMEAACLSQYCCSPTLNTTVSKSPTSNFTYNPSWSVEDACAFNTCSQANQGNPDLGGIGVLVAYFIETSLLALSLITFCLRWITDYVYSKPGKDAPKLLTQHDAAVIASSAVLLDTSAFFALSICFAGVIFNYKDHPLLYEDKLGQTSTLLSIDVPVAIVLLTYTCLDRRKLRIILVILAALMTFLIQFMFRKVKSFNPGTSLCLNWDTFIQDIFRNRFIIKAVWAGLVFLFFISHYIQWNVLRWAGDHAIDNSRTRFWIWKRIGSSSVGLKVLDFNAFVYKMLRLERVAIFAHIVYIRTPWRRFFAYVLATYAMFDTYWDIRFLWFLRNVEKTISSQDNEDQWGYGQILAVFVWVPVLVEYVYVLGFKRELWGGHTIPENPVSHDYEMVEHGVSKIDETQID